MFKQLFVLHADRHSGMPITIESDSIVHWQTCVRSVYIANSADVMQTLQAQVPGTLYQRQEAYRYLLEVICGLQSPLKGETEVLGQFRSRFVNEAADLPGWLFSVVQSLITDSKLIRRNHLDGLGSQSYGSVLRKKIPADHHAVIFGSGSFSREILPWLADLPEVRVVCRDRCKAAGLAEEFPNVSLYEYGEDLELAGCRAAIIVAAPLAAIEIEAHLGAQKLIPSFMFDLRAESDSDVLATSARQYSLTAFFQELVESNETVRSRVDAAFTAVNERIERIKNRQTHRPFGWDDICA